MTRCLIAVLFLALSVGKAQALCCQVDRACEESSYFSARYTLESIFRAEITYAREHPEEGYSKDVTVLRTPELGLAVRCATPPCVENNYKFSYVRLSKSRFRATATPLFRQTPSLELGKFPPTLVVDERGYVLPVGISWPRTWRNERGAVGMLEIISNGGIYYSSMHPETRAAPDLLSIIETAVHGPDSQKFFESLGCQGDSCEKDGYVFTYTHGSKNFVTARPLSYGKAGRFSFYMGLESGVIHATVVNRKATENDLPISSNMILQWEGESPESKEERLKRENPTVPTELVFYKNPRPIVAGDFGPGSRDSSFKLLARVIGLRPLAFDVLDTDAPEVGICGVMIVQGADAELKTRLARLTLDQVVEAKFFLSADSFEMFRMILSELTDARPGSGAGHCSNRSGRVLSYQGGVDQIDIFKDGSIHYTDEHLHKFQSQKLSHEEMDELLRFLSQPFISRLPSSPILANRLDANSITLAYPHYEHLSLVGLEDKLAPLLRLINIAKARATSQSYYVLLTGGRNKLTFLDWPFSQVHANQIATKLNNGVPHPEALHDKVPEDFLSKLPQPKDIPSGRFYPTTFVNDGGELYLVLRGACAENGKGCTTFYDLTMRQVEKPYEVLSRNSGRFLDSPGGLLWPRDLGVDLEQVGPQGRRLTVQEFEDHQPFYGQLYDFAVSAKDFIQGGDLYKDVRICRVDPADKTSPCVERNIH